MTHVPKKPCHKMSCLPFPSHHHFYGCCKPFKPSKMDGLPTRSCSADYRPRLKNVLKKVVFSFKDVSLHLHRAFSYPKYTNTALVNVDGPKIT